MTTVAEVYNEARKNALEATGDEGRAHEIALKATAAVDPSKLQVKCPKCGTGNNPKNAKCSKCKNDLKNAKTPPGNKGTKPGKKPMLFGTKKGEMVQCSNCGTKTVSGPTGTKKCPNCGGAVGNPPKKTNKGVHNMSCPKCSTKNDEDKTKCKNCGTKLPAITSKLSVSVQKVDEDEGLAFGWAYVSEVNGVPVEDHSGESIEITDLEKGVYLYNEGERMGGEMHVEKGCSRMVESMVFTAEKYEALGIDPVGKKFGWWIGMKTDTQQYPEVWSKVKSGEYSQFSIHGDAIKQVVNETEVDAFAAAVAEIAAANEWDELTDIGKAYLTLQANAIQTDRVEKGKGPNPHGPSIKCNDIYEALRKEGKSKEQAAKISNGCYQDPNCVCH